MENIVKDLNGDNTDICLMYVMAERMGKETGILAEPICNIISEEITDHADDLITKAALAFKAATRHGNTATERVHYLGIVDGLCYAIAMTIGVTYTQANMIVIAYAVNM